VRDEHGGDADAVNDVPDLVAGALAQRRVEVRERLVEQQHARLGRERARQRHALLLTA
jgi:hypothetical protein